MKVIVIRGGKLEKGLKVFLLVFGFSVGFVFFIGEKFEFLREGWVRFWFWVLGGIWGLGFLYFILGFFDVVFEGICIFRFLCEILVCFLRFF